MTRLTAGGWVAKVVAGWLCLIGCSMQSGESRQGAERIHAKQILGSAKYPAFCFGGFRGKTRAEEPSVAQVKEDLRILAALGIKLLRTYNSQQFRHATTLLDAIRELRKESPGFEMYVMLGAWIECERAWQKEPNHEGENLANNRAEIDAAVRLANAHPETVKCIAVGNEAMVHWATTYFVRPNVIRKWVDHLQDLKAKRKLPAEVWITSSDNFASWGGEPAYRTDELRKLIESVDFISLHTYPFHHTHYDAQIWGVPDAEKRLPKTARSDAAVKRMFDFGIAQYDETARYVRSLGIDKPIHVGEVGWASQDNHLFGPTGTRAADEYKAKLFYDAMRKWSKEQGVTCFYFEAFDEQWKDAGNPQGAENHFGLFDIHGKAKYALWDQVDAGVFRGLRRGGATISKTFSGDRKAMLASMLPVPLRSQMDRKDITTVNAEREIGQRVTERTLVVVHDTLDPLRDDQSTFPSAPLKLNIWEGTCAAKLSRENILEVIPGSGDWWGCALETPTSTVGEDLSDFESGTLHFEIKGDVETPFKVGLQTGRFGAGTQVNYFVTFHRRGGTRLRDTWASFSIPIAKLTKSTKIAQAKLKDVTSLLYVHGEKSRERGRVELRNVYLTQR